MANIPDPQLPPDEVLLSVDDADFGPMRQIRHWTAAMGEGDVEWDVFDIVFWEGRIGEADFSVYDCPPGELLAMPKASRALFLRLAAQEADIRRDLAERLIDLAKDWALSADMPEPTVASFAASLRLDSISTGDDWRPTLWFDERDEESAIFAGQLVEAYFESDGALIHAELAG